MRMLTASEISRAQALIGNAFHDPDIIASVRLMLANVNANRNAEIQALENQSRAALTRCQAMADNGDPVAQWLLTPIPTNKGDMQAWAESLPDELRGHDVDY